MFNSLHSIATLTTTDASGARRMCVLLADFLRDTLRTGRQNHITLDQELSLASQYLAIERVRFGSRLRVEVEAGAAVRACHVPPLLLQPVVENAVVHGVGQMLDGGTVTLSARRDGAVLVVTSTNPYDPTNPGRRGQGLGLVLLGKRLGTEFGARASVRTQALDAQFRLELRMPAVVEPDVPAADAVPPAAHAGHGRHGGTRENTGSM